MTCSGKKGGKVKKALVTVSGSFKLYQAIFLTQLFPEYKWDILLISYGKKEEIKPKMKKICEKAGCFQHIYAAESNILSSEKLKVLIQYSKLLLFYVLGKRKKCAEGILLRNIECFDYDMFCVAGSYSLIEGAILCFSDQKRVIVMEEGMDDYVNYTPQFGVVERIGAKLLFKMQYINLMCNNFYEPLKYCEKYMRYPHLIKENNYSAVKKMFDYSKVNKSIFQEIIRNAFEIMNDEFDTIIYTDPLWTFGLEDRYCYFTDYIKENYLKKNILLKRHPQDEYKYDFGELKVTERYTEVPGELIMQQWNNAVHIFTFPSTILLGIELENINYKLVQFHSDNLSYNNVFKELIDFFKIPERNIIAL